jgi:cation transporter-like permease
MSPDTERPGLAQRRAPVPGWRIATAVLLAIALTISASAGRVVESIIIAVLLVLALAYLVVWAVALRAERLGDRDPTL